MTDEKPPPEKRDDRADPVTIMKQEYEALVSFRNQFYAIAELMTRCTKLTITPSWSVYNIEAKVSIKLEGCNWDKEELSAKGETLNRAFGMLCIEIGKHIFPEPKKKDAEKSP